MDDHRLQTVFLRVALGRDFYPRWPLNPWFPSAVIPLVGWLVTILETVLGILLVVGFKTRWSALLSGWLLLAFAIGMIAGIGPKSVFDYSVLAAAGGALMLATARRYAWSVDARVT
jgi:uncharacterized membrane protein YphA (DoxX/SURF4 family)